MQKINLGALPTHSPELTMQIHSVGIDRQNIFDTKSEKKPAVLVPPNGECKSEAEI